MPFIRSVSGLRATVADSLPDNVVQNYSIAFAEYLPDGPVCVGLDGRMGGIRLAEICAKALKDYGRKVIFLGTVPTPTVQLMVEKNNAAGGIAVTASHNPAEWNGMKFINSDGVFLNKTENESFWKLVDSEISGKNKSIGKIIYKQAAVDEHIDLVLSLTKNIEEIAGYSLKVVVDAVNASGSVIVPRLLEKFGCDVTKLYCSGIGKFPHPPEPVPENLRDLCKSVKENNADLGIAVDPDADRLVLIDGTGEPIGEEKTIALAVQSVLSDTNADRAAVVNLSTSRMVDDLCKKYAVELLRSPVGEINVVSKMKETGAVIGGEGSGGVIWPDCHYGRDSLSGISLVLSLMAKENKSLKELSDSLTKYSMIKKKMQFTGDLEDLFVKAESEFNNGIINREDGLRIDFPDSWVQVRASNTEPIMRIIAEAPVYEQAYKLASTIMKFAEAM